MTVGELIGILANYPFDTLVFSEQTADDMNSWLTSIDEVKECTAWYVKNSVQSFPYWSTEKRNAFRERVDDFGSPRKAIILTGEDQL